MCSILLNIFIEVHSLKKQISHVTYKIKILYTHSLFKETIMALTPEQITAANKANMETLANLTRKAFDGIEKLLELNIQVAKTVMDEQVSHIQSTANVKDAQELMSLQAKFVQPLAQKAISYGRHLHNIAYETQSALIETSKLDFQDRSKRIQSIISEMTSNAPSSADAMMNVIKQAMANANQVYESSQRAIKQAVDMSSHQAKTATESAVKASEEIFKSAQQ